MLDLFGKNRNENEHDDGRPRIIFANLRRPSRPILTEAGYKVFSATSFSIWTVVVLIVWIFRVEVSISKELVTSFAGSSVELSALSLAVLGILHELNKEDKWFKLGLFLVSILFVAVVICGFYLALTWQPAFNSPQKITIVIIAALGLVAIIQINWKVALRLTRISWIASIVLPTKLTTAIQLIRLTIPFAVPILLVWLPNLNRVTAVVVLFAGALISLVALMGVTTFSLLKSKKETEPEDSFIATLRARYESEIKAIIRLGELKVRTLDALEFLQTLSIQTASQENEAPALVARASIIIRLRQMNVMEDERTLDGILSSLVSESLIFRKDYDSFWTVPNHQTVTNCLNCLNELAIIGSAKNTVFTDKTDYIIDGYKFTSLREWLAVHAQLPATVVGEYVMPKVLEVLLDHEKFYVLRNRYQHIFINRMWKISSDEWKRRLKNTETKYRGQYNEDAVLEIFLNSLPYSSDPNKYNGKGGDPIRYSRQEIDTIMSILSGQNATG